MTSTRVWLLTAVVAVVVAGVAVVLLTRDPPGEQIAGLATVPRTGVLEIDGTWVHMLGISPPREDPDCRANGAIFQCTLLHRARLAEWIADRVVTCDIERFPGDDRIWGTCRADGREYTLNRELARTGWAFIDTHLTQAYAPDVDFARKNYEGMWAGFIRRDFLQQDVVKGAATIRNAGVIEVEEIDVHLLGVDAPPLEQMCTLNGLPYQCGVLGRAFLDELLTGATIACEVRYFDGDERVWGVCGASGRGRSIASGSPIINELVVAAGWALARRTEALDYSEQETAARNAGAGLWIGDFIVPSAWLAGQR